MKGILGIRAVRALAVAGVLLASVPAFAWKFDLGEHTNLNVDYLLQAQAQFAEKAAPDKTAWSKDFFLRRSRILLFGDLWKGISFFMETEQANMGKGGDWAVPFFVQDAFVTFKAHEAFMVDAGMILLPFSRFNVQGAVGLNGLDYHSGLVRFVDGSTKVWRDAGLQLRGYAYGKRFQYRVGVFNGAQNQALQKDASGKSVLSSNPEDWPRFTGMVRYTFLGDDSAFFPKGLYFAKSPVVSVGAGFDFQYDAVMDRPATLDATKMVVKDKGRLTHAAALSADVFAEVPFGPDGDQEIVFQGGFFWYDQGSDVKVASNGTATVVPAKNSGLGVATELGYRWTFLEPILSVDWFDSRQAAADLLAVRGGLNFWIRGHGASVKTEFGAQKNGDLSKAAWSKVFTTQAQLYF